MRETSVQSYHENTQLFKHLKGEVMREILTSKTPATASEIAERIPGRRINSINPRFAELEAMNVIRSCPPRRCTVTGKSCVTWEATGHAPAAGRPRRDKSKTESRAKLLCRIQALQAQNAELQARINKWGRPPSAKIKAAQDKSPVFDVFHLVTPA